MSSLPVAYRLLAENQAREEMEETRTEAEEARKSAEQAMKEGAEAVKHPRGLRVLRHFLLTSSEDCG